MPTEQHVSVGNADDLVGEHIVRSLLRAADYPCRPVHHYLVHIALPFTAVVHRACMDYMGSPIDHHKPAATD